MNVIIKILTLSLIFGITACSVEPVPINYGTDACDFCSMNIVDAKYAAQLVTDKGKNYKFDAIECMIHYLNDNQETTMNYILVADFSNPGHMIDVQKATFLIHPNLPSPMGANLSAYSTKDALAEVMPTDEGKILEWEKTQLLVNNQR